ncbi:MAG: hypothetical protein V7724_18760 [Sediminicola sp.]
MKTKTRVRWGIIFSLLFTATLLTTSCEDDDDGVLVIYSYEDAQEAIAISLAYESYGLVANFDKVSEEIEGNHECEVLNEESESETGDFTASGLTTYVYDYTESFTKYCDPDLYVSYDLLAEQTIESVRISKTHTIHVDFITTGLEDSSENEIYNGAYTRNGGWETVYSNENYDFTYESDVVDVQVSKETGKIVSGTSTFTLTEEYSYNNLTYTYTGIVKFIDEDKAKITFDSGEVFYVNTNNLSISN